MNKRVLIVEDEPDIVRGLTDALEFEGFDVVSKGFGKDGVRIMRERGADCVILDLMLPDINGSAVCEEIRDFNPVVPIIILTARGQESDKIRGLDAGADDYVTKPFSTAVLLARIRANLRSSALNDPEAPIQLGRLSVDPAAYLTQVDGAVVDLRPREFELLLALVRSAGRVSTRERLLSDVWDMHWETSTKTLDMHIHVLRRKLAGVVDIATVRGVGYRLEAP